ncbi:ComF family protein [Paenibacillus albiflavus]|uniref:ComF family protein n=1 Tax=Paenibacillus albiflavus TaxID=2545760 RepID=A0A4R4EBZ0_9BACL|nr:ComF family protein [Paenibacillus albiflavus]TCZ76837.1 ComF family protein [Paenibacillus albiflavus]
MSKLVSWFQDLHRVLRPAHQTCIQCNQQAVMKAEWLGFCKRCMERIPWIREIHCPTCGRYETCPDCHRRTDQKFVMNRSAVQYNADMKAMLARYKYRGDERLCETMSNMLMYAYVHLQSALTKNQASGKRTPNERYQQIITYVPISPERQAERGFNQAELLALRLGQQVKLPVIDLLQRTRHTDKQSFKSRSERLDSLDNVFRIKKDIDNQLISADIHAIRIYVIDDVYTTGSTLQQCASAIKEAWPLAEVYGLAWAR